MKLFETFNIEIVNYCQTPFGCDLLLSDLCMNMLNNVSDSLILLHFIVYIMFLFPYWVFFMFLRLLTTIVFYDVTLFDVRSSHHNKDYRWMDG